MKKVEIKFDKNSFKKYVKYSIEHRKLFFMIFFSALFVFTFNVIYKNAYYDMKYIDYAESGNFEGNKIKKNTMFKEIIKNINFRKQAMQDVRNKEYKNIFSFNDVEDLDENDDNNENDNEKDNPILPIEPNVLPKH